MSKYNILDMVKDKKQATYTRYRKQHLYYITECGFEFPVPIDDIGDATFNNTEKASSLMRYIRKHIETLSGAE